MTFSGGENLIRLAKRLETIVAVAAMEEGFRLNFRKTRVQRQANRQVVTGVVVNEKTNVSRRDFDLLKATVTNCVRKGPASQNRDQHKDFRSHLAGRIGYVRQLNPVRADKLKAIFDQIVWP